MRLHLTTTLLLPLILQFSDYVDSAAIDRRDASFLQVRTKQTRDMSGRAGDPKEKYFHESVFHPHYDGRFADHELNYVERKRDLSNLMQTYLATFSDIGVETWIMHGTLLGWWWNRKILPWDSDVDVQVAEESMHFLASYYNMSVFHYKTPRIPEGRDYMLEVNPHYIIRDQSDRLNVIDARWTDTESGLFIDITTVRKNDTHPAGPGILSCKDKHEYREDYIFPLRDSFFEGQAVKVPYAYAEVLSAEYGEFSLTNTNFQSHHFDEEKMEWTPVLKKQASVVVQAAPPAAMIPVVSMPIGEVKQMMTEVKAEKLAGEKDDNKVEEDYQMQKEEVVKAEGKRQLTPREVLEKKLEEEKSNAPRAATEPIQVS